MRLDAWIATSSNCPAKTREITRKKIIQRAAGSTADVRGSPARVMHFRVGGLRHEAASPWRVLVDQRVARSPHTKEHQRGCNRAHEHEGGENTHAQAPKAPRRKREKQTPPPPRLQLVSCLFEEVGAGVKRRLPVPQSGRERRGGEAVYQRADVLRLVLRTRHPSDKKTRGRARCTVYNTRDRQTAHADVAKTHTG